MNIRAGLVSHSLVWEQVLRQEGVPYSLVDLKDENPADRVSFLIVNRSLTGSEGEEVVRYLRGGGGVLGYVRHLTGVPCTTSRPEQVDYLVSEKDRTFPQIGILDAGTMGEIPREANTLRTQLNSFAVFAGELEGGCAVLLPFDCERLLADDRTAVKNFYSGSERLPSERVSLVAKGELRALLHCSFEFLHHARGWPYAHLWYFPGGKPNIFAFRIDSDGAPRKDVDELYAVAREHGIGMSWYLDVKSHEEWLGHFGSMVDQEIGVHCYEHEVYPTYDENARNISKARHLMESAGLHPSGFAGPRGTWNPQLAKVLDDLGFAYSSEFSYAYDTLPMYSWSGTAQSRVLQVPVHPICIGSLRKVGYSDKQMIDYYERVIERHMTCGEPLFFYHHPTHRRWNVVEKIFSLMKERQIESSTLGEFAEWWKERSGVTPRLEVGEGKFCFATEEKAWQTSGERITVHVTTPKGEEAYFPSRGSFVAGGAVWKEIHECTPPSDIRRVRDFDPRGLLAEVYSIMMRKIR